MNTEVTYQNINFKLIEALIQVIEALPLAERELLKQRLLEDIPSPD